MSLAMSLAFVPMSLVADDLRAARRSPAGSPIVFGREAVFVLPDDAGPIAGLSGARRALAPDRVLAAVVQKGRLFEQAHPDVTVVRDRGRFLLVELSPDHPTLAAQPTSPATRPTGSSPAPRCSAIWTQDVRVSPRSGG